MSTPPDNPSITEEAITPEAPAREPFWGWLDVLIVLGLLVSMFFALGVLTLLASGAPGQRNIPVSLLLPLQLAFYGAIYLALKLDIRYWHGKSVFVSLGWRRTVSNRTLLYIGLAGVVLAPVIDGVAVLLHTPEVQMDILEQLKDRPVILALFGVMAVTIGPVFEELFFRGFLQPVFCRTLGMSGGILLTALLFGVLHAAQYKDVWQYVAGVSLVGAVLGVIRYRTKSIIPGIVMHACYNSVAAVGIFFEHK